LARAGLGRGEIYITNVLKCRPPNNRRPAREEIEACTPLLNKQIEVISPRIIVTLGATAGEVVFRKYGFKWEGMLKENARPRVINTVFGSVTLLPAIHPAAVLRNPNWQRSLDAAMEKLAEIRK
jgi:uracil-DNA glycosylase family 4